MLGRWFIPLGVVWAQLFLSAFVFERRLPEGLRNDPSLLLVELLLGTPGLSTVLLWGFRRLDQQDERRSSVGNTLVIWVMAFMFMTHAIILGVVIGALEGLHPWMSFAVVFLLLGTASLLPALPPESPYGFRVLATRDHQQWRRIHRGLALSLGLSAIVICLTATLSSKIWVALGLVPTAAGLLWAWRTQERASAIEQI